MAAALSVASPAVPAHPQTFEGLVLRSWSRADLLEGPQGFGLAFTSPYRGWLAPRVGYAYRIDGRSGRGRACPSFHPCDEEDVEEEATLHAVDAGVNARFPIGERTHARAGLSVLWLRADGEIRGRDTGGTLELGPTSALGWTFRLGTEWEPGWAFGVALLAEGRLEAVVAGDCATESYVPFCDDPHFLSLALGLSGP